MMSSDNETVSNIVKIMRHGDNRLAMQQVVMREFADRIEVSHKREIAELKAKLSNTETARKFFATRLVGAKKEVAELRECLRIIRDNLLLHTIKSEDGKCVNKGAFLSEEFVDDERWRKALEGSGDGK